MTPFSLAVFLCAAFTLLGLMHVYWALGGRRGLQATLPQLPVPPDRQQAGEPAQRTHRCSMSPCRLLLAPWRWPCLRAPWATSGWSVSSSGSRARPFARMDSLGVFAAVRGAGRGWAGWPWPDIA
jgi:hypothetical protein